MMKRYMRSVERRIVRKRSEQGEGVAGNPPEKRMLTFRRRSSSRVFVPKKVIAGKEHGEVNYLPRAIQSGKRLYLSEPPLKSGDLKSGEFDDIRWLGTIGKEDSRMSEPVVRTSDANGMDTVVVQGAEKMFVNVYSRKRPRNSSWSGLESSSSYDGGQTNDPRFKVVFSRKVKNKRPAVTNDFGEGRGFGFGEIGDFFREGLRHERLQFKQRKCNLLELKNIAETELWTSFGESLVLVLLSESSCDDNLLRFSRFLISVISWMSRARMNVHYLSAFLLSEPIGSAFLQQGIHFLPVTDRNQNFLLGSSISNFGICNIYSSCEFLPLIFLNFLALPSYFKSLHFAALLDSRYLHFPLSTYLMASNMKLNPDTECEDINSNGQLETDFLGTIFSSSISATVNKKACSATTQTSSAIMPHSNGYRPRKLQRKRSFLKHSNTRKFSSVNCCSTSYSSQNGDLLSSLYPLPVRQPETSTDDPLIFHRNKVICALPVSPSKRSEAAKRNYGGKMKEIKAALSLTNGSSMNVICALPVSHPKLTDVAKKNHCGQMREIKAALTDIKQNIDSVQCNANILVTAGDKCWREEGAVVSMELSSSKEWSLAVRIGSNLRYLHRPQDMKYTLNRFTHAHIWIVEDGWRLEFSEKWDWLQFKELHAECRQRNNQPEDASAKVIPIPVFNDVTDCENGRVSRFERPEQYIRMKHADETLRASVSEAPYYDMDSGDEEWLQKHNSSRSTTENDTCSYLSENAFESMIFTFEKNAYYSSSNSIFSEREPNSFEELGSKDIMSDVYDYWLKKRKQRNGPLVRVFQGPSQRKSPLLQRKVLRKRRSLKKQRNQVGRVQPSSWFNSKAKQEAKADALQNAREAENAWHRSIEAAVPLRQRAQLLMENADLATYKSVMALRIAEAIRSKSADHSSSSSSSSLSSSLLDWLPEDLSNCN